MNRMIFIYRADQSFMSFTGIAAARHDGLPRFATGEEKRSKLFSQQGRACSKYQGKLFTTTSHQARNDHEPSPDLAAR
ncbi:hypothetical protein [Herbaspirillum sp. CAH-3]|uniref:hypothetical protein n=1 Tax=Herbaspirillum sp. CAH-3 TaxID=2605746 RepID=UPI0012ACAEA8|nr:hypothetical protein [Herbaspirillum sp. CAH-3]MRT29325.1 hypothetical protein [Herbaspirillum sp. CAH-3]